MLSYVTIGANDVQRSGAFYSAILLPLGYTARPAPDAIEFTPPAAPGGVTLYLRKPFDGQPACVGNGAMVAFQAGTQALVRRLHAAGMAAGGRCEGAPGFRDAYGDAFYVGYLRDPLGNKVAIFCNDPAEGRRGG